ncbi:MAG: hypothetical protein WC655_05755 [Candidatus Hydrogenedentales bacterium]
MLDIQCYDLLHQFVVLQHLHRGGIYRKDPVDGPIERSATEAIRLLRHVEDHIRRIARAQNVQIRKIVRRA